MGLRPVRREWLLPLALALAGASFTASAEEATPEKASDSEKYATGVFHCERVTWMDNCETINRIRHEQPQAHIRVQTRDGLELILPPETPTAAIRHFVLETPEAAEEYARYLDRVMQHGFDAVERLAAAQQRVGTGGALVHGGALSGDEISVSPDGADRITDREVRDANVSLYVFYDTHCSACDDVLGALRALQDDYPSLFISPLQLDDDRATLRHAADTHGLDARILDGAALSQWRARISTTPTLIFESDNATSQTVLVGARGRDQLEQALHDVASGSTRN